ncbi:MAG: family transcriptional regulator, cyclic receptor protein [Miltoncostaeaceae bacterium]|jgi:CRP-like cAMP-binding protein|nr:family transcriptional regulator, cyclic receptor protein [Miltoncostaeaceae bacterium]
MRSAPTPPGGPLPRGHSSASPAHGSPRLPSLAHSGLVDHIPQEDVERLERSLPLVPWQRGEDMPAPLRLDDHLYVVRAGMLALLEPASNDHMVMTALLETGAIYSTLGNARPPQGLALEDSVVSPISGEALEALIAKLPRLGRNLAEALSDRVAMLRETVAIVSEMRVEDRLAARMHQLAERSGVATRDGVKLRLALTHSQWGLAIGASREAVTSAFGRLRARGLVSVVDREVTIPWEVVRARQDERERRDA